MNPKESKTVLVVDDDATQRKLIASYLASRGYVCPG
jgi:CheY-like chemotaxis protein